MPLWLIIAVLADIAFTALQMLLSRHGEGQKPSALGEFDAPTAEEGRCLPVIFGTVLLKAPNVTSYGDLSSIPLKKGGGFWNFGKTVIVAYKYFLGMQLTLCHGPVDSLVDIQIDGKSMALNPTNVYKNQTFTTVAEGLPQAIPAGSHKELNLLWPSMFGGEDAQGGVQGRIDVYFGGTDQGPDSYLASNLLHVTTAPAYRGVCHVVCRKPYVGLTNQLKNWAFELARFPNNLGLSSGHNKIGNDANPAEMIYELLTNDVWALNQPTGKVDLTSFRAAGETLFTESMGMSWILDSTQAADSTMGDILRHIDAVLFTDPATGLWTLNLVRADYDPDDLLELSDEDGSILEPPQFSRGSWEETLNEVKIQYLARDNHDYVERVAQAQDIANFTTRGELLSDTMQFRGFTGDTLAQTIAMRELKIGSYPLGKAHLRVNRKAWNLRIGQAFKMTWTPQGITGLPMRVTQINYGSLNQNRIEMDVVEDIFGVNFTAYTPPTTTGWVDPNTDPIAPTARLVIEGPYQLVTNAERRVLVGIVRADGVTVGCEVWELIGSAYTQRNSVNGLVPSGLLNASYARNHTSSGPTDHAAFDATGFVLKTTTDLDILANTTADGRDTGKLLALFAATGEIVSFTTLTDNGDGTWTLAGVVRGVFDTVPVDHSTNERVYILAPDSVGSLRDDALVSDASVTLKLLPFSGKSTYPLTSASSDSLTTASRALRPYPPGNVTVNGEYWPNGGNITGDATLSWATRTRTAQQAQDVIHQNAGNTGAGEGDVTIETYIAAGLVRTATGQPTGGSYVYTAAQRIIDDVDATKPVHFRIIPVNGSLTGVARITDTFIFT
jgi:hypothetical protein